MQDRGELTRSASVKPTPMKPVIANSFNSSFSGLSPLLRKQKKKPTKAIIVPLSISDLVPTLRPDGKPAVSALAWGICDGNTAELLCGCNEDVRCEMASLTKVMTCYLSLRLVQTSSGLAFDQRVRVSRLAATMPGTRAGLREGDEVSVWDLLHALMLPSGNDAAWCLAEHFGKYIQAVVAEHTICRDYVGFFLMEMNVMAEDMGLSRTVFDTPHGLPNAKNRSCVRDLGKLVCICMKNSMFREIVSTRSYTCLMHNHDLHWLNTNKLLDHGWIGVKTGVTSAAGPCLSATFLLQDQLYVVTLLKCPSLEARWKDAVTLAGWVRTK